MHDHYGNTLVIPVVVGFVGDPAHVGLLTSYRVGETTVGKLVSNLSNKVHGSQNKPNKAAFHME